MYRVAEVVDCTLYLNRRTAHTCVRFVRLTLAIVRSAQHLSRRREAEFGRAAQFGSQGRLSYTHGST